MPRVIGAPRNLLVFNDHISGDKLGLYYRMPTTKEREGFLNAAVRRKGNKVTMHHAEARLVYGMKILTGIREGDFMRMDGDKAVLMSSDKNSDSYCESWKEEMQAGCADLVMALGGHVFDLQPTASQEREDEEDEEDLQGE